MTRKIIISLSILLMVMGTTEVYGQRKLTPIFKPAAVNRKLPSEFIRAPRPPAKPPVLKPGNSQSAGFANNHSRKHGYNPGRRSTSSRSQFGSKIDVREMRNQTISDPDKRTVMRSNKGDHVVRYEKNYSGNISTKDTPTGQSRVIVDHTKGSKVSTQFPHVPRGKNK